MTGDPVKPMGRDEAVEEAAQEIARLLFKLNWLNQEAEGGE